jgi:two-component system sensor histidine kinase BaeS
MMLSGLRRRLAWKLFLSYLMVIVVGVIVLATAAELSVPAAFNSHLAAMSAMMNTQGMNLDLLSGFRAALTESLVLATAAATGVAVLVSVLISRQVVAPVRDLQRASQRIAGGDYDQRVSVPGNPARGELDELGELALNFNQMANRLEQVESMRRQLLGDVTHELRTPLTAIKGTMEALIDEVLPATAETYQQIYREADRLQRLVSDIQELSRVEARAFPLDLRPLPVSRLMTTLIARLGRQFEEKGVDLRTDVPADLPPLLGDEDRLGQVLLNLVGNALQYTPPAGSVVVSARRKGDEIQIAVTDSGLGIAAEHLPHVFDRFYRVDKSRSRAAGGSGIGLTIARHLVEAHGGTLGVVSTGLGQGSTFTARLPLAS